LAPPMSSEIGMPQSAQAHHHQQQHSTADYRMAEPCLECGAPSMAYEEGCKKCYTCGFSKC